jgi:hypothetical protein
MNRRVAAVLLAIALYSGGIATLNSVILPAAGINGFAQLESESFDFLGPGSADAPASAAGGATAARTRREHSWGAAKLFSLWLRPFGVHRSDMNDAWWALGSFAVIGTAAAAILFMFPKRVRYVSQILRDEPLANHVFNAVLGLLAYAVAYALLRLSWLTIVGLPFIPFLAGGVWLLTMLGIISVSFTFGRGLMRRFGAPLPALAETLLGLWLLFVTSMLPFFGWVVGVLAAALGFGVLLQTRFGTRQRWSLDVLEEPFVRNEPIPDDPKILPLRRAR